MSQVVIGLWIANPKSPVGLSVPSVAAVTTSPPSPRRLRLPQVCSHVFGSRIVAAANPGLGSHGRRCFGQRACTDRKCTYNVHVSVLARHSSGVFIIGVHVNASIPGQIQKQLDHVHMSVPARPSPSGLVVCMHVNTVFSGERLRCGTRGRASAGNRLQPVEFRFDEFDALV